MHSQKLKNCLPNYVEGIYIELNLRKSEWLLFGCYHPSFQSDEYFDPYIKINMDKLSQKYKKYMLIGNINAEDSEICLSNFMKENVVAAANLKNIKKKKKKSNIKNPS